MCVCGYLKKTHDRRAKLEKEQQEQEQQEQGEQSETTRQDERAFEVNKKLSFIYRPGLHNPLVYPILDCLSYEQHFTFALLIFPLSLSPLSLC